MPDMSWFMDLYAGVVHFFSTDAEELLRNYGYYAILLLTFLEGETIVIIAGMLAAKGILNPYYVALSAYLGSFCSDQLMFSLGKYKGSAILRRFPKLEKKMGSAIELFEKYNTSLILGFRFVYGIRNVTPIMLGISHVSHKKFFTLNFLGAGIWAASFTYGGYFFGKIFEDSMGSIGLFILLFLLLVVGSVWFFVYRKKSK